VVEAEMRHVLLETVLRRISAAAGGLSGNVSVVRA
jgi:hypothetical protein